MGKRKNREKEEPLNESPITSTEDDIPKKKKLKKKRKREESLLDYNSTVNNSNEEELVKKEKKVSKKNRNVTYISTIEAQTHDVLGAVNEHEKCIPKENNISKVKKDKTFKTATSNTTVENKDKSIKSKKLDKSSPNVESLRDKAKQNKKIIFDDETGEPQDPPDPVPPISNSTKKHKGHKKPAIYTPEEPTDAEIDQFCDEIDEHDNVQYENWIQLIESKLGSIKKK